MPGTYRLQVCADAGTDIDHPETMPEKDESDNCKTSVGTVRGDAGATISS